MVLRIRSQKRNVSMYDTGSFAMCQSVISSRNNRVIGREREGVNSHSSFMGCFGCHFCKSNRKLHRESSQRHIVRTHSVIENQQQEVTASCEKEADDEKKVLTFSYSELAAASSNFDPKCFLGEGGFGKVHKGYLEKPNQYVAIKQLDRNGCQGAREFIVEVLTLSLADHPNLVKLIGYCAERNQRLLVYEYMPLGSLENHLHDLRPGSTGLDWTTRLRIAAGAARGLEYLHKKMNPPVIYRDLKCSNILLGHEYHPKLSDFGLAKVGPLGGKTHVSTRVMGTYGYCAPEYAKTGQLTFKSDIYSFGVVLLEIFTGRKAIDFGRPYKEQNLVAWARPLFKARKNFVEMADPLLKGRFPVKALCQVLYIAAQCIQEKPNMRPSIVDITNALDFLAEKQSP